MYVLIHIREPGYTRPRRQGTTRESGQQNSSPSGSLMTQTRPLLRPLPSPSPLVHNTTQHHLLHMYIHPRRGRTRRRVIKKNSYLPSNPAVTNLNGLVSLSSSDIVVVGLYLALRLDFGLGGGWSGCRDCG